MPDSAFSDLAWRSSISRMSAASIFSARQSSMGQSSMMLVAQSRAGGDDVSAPDRADNPPSWYTATAMPAPERAPLTADLDVDVCVVGAGLAGLTTAREIARCGWSVAVLESGRI